MFKIRYLIKIGGSPMKKLLALFLALFLLLALFGACSIDTPSDNSASLPEDGTSGDTDEACPASSIIAALEISG